METIQATVNPRLLTKANRLFTGTLEGRIIEILQNARRAGATEVEITNQDGCVTVRDNGKGIDDFSRLLDLGGSGWTESLETSEDPAGVGLFCLSPRRVTVRSNGRTAVIHPEAWTGVPVAVTDDPEAVRGTVLKFEDEPWLHTTVEQSSIFSGLRVTVDSVVCASEPFVSDQASPHPELGCRIEVCESAHLKSGHRAIQGGYCSNSVLVNYHGQVVAVSFHPVSHLDLVYLVELTGEPTGIRLMLPARTQLVQNQSLDQLKAAIELEAFRYLQRRGHHRLSYKEYHHARELGIILPEAKPTFRVGLVSSDPPEPVKVAMPEHFPLGQCYRLGADREDGDETDEANVHLLAALGKFPEPFVPVEISSKFDGYAWANLPTITKVELHVGKTICESWLWSGRIICVDQIVITAHTSNGKVFTSAVPMAIRDRDAEGPWIDQDVLVTPEAQERLTPEEIWFHLGGYGDEGDTYATQEAEFNQQLDDFWARLVGPYEQLRLQILESMAGLDCKWQSATILANGTLTITMQNGTRQDISPLELSSNTGALTHETT
jgi:hypothetical protein